MGSSARVHHADGSEGPFATRHRIGLSLTSVCPVENTRGTNRRPLSLLKTPKALILSHFRAPLGTLARAMLAFFVAALRSTTRSRLELAAEILALRHQLAVLRQRAPKRLR